PLADIHDAGLSIYVATDRDQALADALADELAEAAWALRREFLHTALSVKDAVARALALDGRPVVLADIADNTGGGAAGDTTGILRELLRVGARPPPVAYARPRDDPLCRHRSRRRAAPGGEILRALPCCVRADRPRDPRGRRARAVFVQPGTVPVRPRAAADLPARRPVTATPPGRRRCPLPRSTPETSGCST